MQCSTSIYVTFQREGTHCFPQAATDPNLSDVSFLGYPHRHIFHFKVSIEVFHDDRDLEFIQVKRFCESLYASNNASLQLDHKSCEMIAAELYRSLAVKYGTNRCYTIDVAEDGENGCVATYPRNYICSPTTERQ